MNIREEIITIKDSIINWRRDFHQYPELAFKEHRTGDVIVKELRSMGMEPKENVGKTGVTADLQFGVGPMIGLRADMDALPIQETSGRNRHLQRRSRIQLTRCLPNLRSQYVQILSK